MREYLFRAKTKLGSTWVFGDLIRKGKLIYIGHEFENWVDDYSVENSAGAPGRKSEMHYAQVEVIPETIGQYTGLEKDKQKIFEDDLISHGNGKYLYVVKFEDGKFVGYHAIKKEWGKWGDLHRLFDLDFKGFDWSIAGNIHDNTELLTTTTNT